MKLVPATVSRTAARQILHMQKHSPRLLFVTGIAGAVTATVLACRATLKIEDILLDGQKELAQVSERSRERTHIRIDTARRIAAAYAPAVVVGVGAVACLTKSHQILRTREAAATAAYAALSSRFDNYRDRVAAQYGRENESDIYEDVQACEIEDPDSGKKRKHIGPSGKGGSIYARWFDRNSPSWEPIPESNVFFLRMQQNHWNERLHTKGHVFLNEVYDGLGIERSAEGQFVGWVHDEGDNYISFGIFDNPEMDRLRDFGTGAEGGIWLDFNVDGPIYNKI